MLLSEIKQAIGCLCGCGMFAEAILGTIAIMTVNIVFKHLRGHDEHADHPDHSGQL